MAFSKWNSSPPPAASAKNVAYIARDEACDSLSFYNLPELETGDRQGNKTNAIAHAEERLEQEKDTRGERTHFRFVLGFDRDVSTAEAKEEAYKYLEKEFPNSKCIVAVHQEKNKKPGQENEKHTHVHIHMDCRDTNDKKINIAPSKYKTMDERWARQYDKKYGTEYEQQFKELKTETQEWKKEYAIAKENGTELPKKPERVADTYYKNKKEKYQDKDRAAAGITYDKTGNGRDYSATSNGQRGAVEGQQELPSSEPQLTQSEQAVNRSEQQINRADSSIDNAARRADELSNSVSKLAERGIPDRGLKPVEIPTKSRDDSRGR